MLAVSSSSRPAIIKTISSKEKKASDVIPDLNAKSEKSKGNINYWIVMLNKTGVFEWQKSYEGEYADLLGSVEQTKDSGHIGRLF